MKSTAENYFRQKNIFKFRTLQTVTITPREFIGQNLDISFFTDKFHIFFMRRMKVPYVCLI